MMQSLSTQTLLLLLCFQIPSILTKNPGLEAQVSQVALDYAGNIAVNILDQNLDRNGIQNLAGQGRVAVGVVSYVLSNIKITDFTKPTSAVGVNPGVGLSWFLQNAGLSLTGDWFYQYNIWFATFTDRGSFKATMRGVSAAVVATITTLSNGTPTIRVLYCNSNIDKLDVQFTGGASWLYNLFYGFAESPLKRLLEKEICNAAGQKTIDINAESFLQSLETKVTLEDDIFTGQTFVIDYSLIKNPTFAEGYIQTAHRGEVFHASDGSTAPFDAPLINLPAPTGMVTIYLNEYLGNTLGYVLLRNNLLRIYVTRDSRIQDSYISYFNTTCTTGVCVGTALPALADKYPNSFVELNVTATSAPQVSITSEAVSITCSGKINIFARLPDGSIRDVALASGQITGKVSLSSRGDIVLAAVSEFVSQVTIESSGIGEISKEILDDITNIATTQLIIPRLNHYGNKGLKLPKLGDITFTKPSVALIQGAVAVSTDVSYSTDS